MSNLKKDNQVQREKKTTSQPTHGSSPSAFWYIFFQVSVFMCMLHNVCSAL